MRDCVLIGACFALRRNRNCGRHGAGYRRSRKRRGSQRFVHLSERTTACRSSSLQVS